MNVAMIGHGSVEGTNLLGGVGGMHPKNKDEILDPQIAGNALKLSSLLSPHYIYFV